MRPLTAAMPAANLGEITRRLQSTTQLPLMTISQKHRKLLWVRSGNQCAFPGCQQPLVHEPVGAGLSSIVGEEAHIIAKEKSGPRGEPRDDVDIDAYHNLMLLCPTHHRIVDAQPGVYSVSALTAMKAAHEAAVRDRLAVGPDPRPLDHSL
jgi:hypothetical protein